MPKADDHTGWLVADRYLLQRPIGEGGFGRVYLATDQRLDIAVAVKVIHPWWAGDGEWIGRFAEEAKTAARVNHPGVVRVTDTGSDPVTGPYMVSELVDGESLRSLLDREGTLAPVRAAGLMAQAADALAASHMQGVVHRDIKPANLLLGRDGRLRVCDFGIARLQSGATRSSASHTLVGTPAYMAPEQALGKAAGPQADQYALGTVLFEMLTGRPPFEGDTPVATALAQLAEEAPTVPASVPAHLRDLLHRALAKDPAGRFPDCRTLAQALRADATAPSRGRGSDRPTRRAARRPTGPQHDPSAPTTPLRPRRRRHRLTIGLLAAAALTVAGAAVAVLALDGSESPAPAGAAAAETPDASSATSPPAAAAEPAVARVPDVVGLPVARAQARLQRRGLGFVAVRRKSVRQPEGHVVSQRPKAATTLQEGENVALTVSDGPPPVEVPDVNGMSTEQATTALTSAGLTVGTTRDEVSARPAGTVLRTDPVPGSSLPPGTAVTLVLARAKTWQTVGTYSFTSDGQTPRFRIRADDWRISYTMKRSCSYGCVGADLILMPGYDDLELSEGTHSTAIAAGPGRYYFEFESWDPATLELTIEELR